jgi:hypothetical protein
VAHTLTLQDIAQLSKVTRQAVTNWRRRSLIRGRRIPFPEPVEVVDGVERFELEAVLGWLEATGRGNNDEAREDAPALSPPDGADLDDVVVLLALRALSGVDLSQQSTDELVELAETVDPGDGFLLSEVRSMSTDVHLLEYVDALMSVSFGPEDALDRLYASRLTRWTVDRGLTEDLLDLLACVGAACREHLGPDDVALDARLDVRAARRVARGFGSVRPAAERASGRGLLRQLVLSGTEMAGSGVPSVRVLSVIGVGDDDALELVDSLALELGPNDVAVVLGSAGILCGQLRGERERRRSETVRLGSVVMAVRLPRGQWKEAHRQSLGLWVLKGGTEAASVVVADLTSAAIDLGDLASDVTAALEQAGERAYRYGRRVLRSDLGGRNPVVAAGMRAVHLVDPLSDTQRDRITAATLVTSEPLEGYDMLVGPAPAPVVTAPRSLGEMVSSRRIELLSGSRIDPAHADPSGSMPVISATPARGRFTLDPLDGARLYGHARRTEPGDVVFADRPRPLAVLDEAGGALVMTPSRVLRLPHGAGIGPRALAEVINHLPDDAGEWRTWIIPRLAPEQVDVVEHALAGAGAHVAELRRRLDAMSALVTDLIEGVAAGVLAISSSTTSPTTTKKAG